MASVRGQYQEVRVDLRNDIAVVVLTLEKRRGQIRIPIAAAELDEAMRELAEHESLTVRIDVDGGQLGQLLTDLARTADWFEH